MPATYNPALPTDKDWVRLLSGDRDITRPKLDDYEINGLLAEEANKYLAAARACEVILSKSNGLVAKEVGDLKLRWTDKPEDAYRRYIRDLRRKGAGLTHKKPSSFRVLRSKDG